MGTYKNALRTGLAGLALCILAETGYAYTKPTVEGTPFRVSSRTSAQKSDKSNPQYDLVKSSASLYIPQIESMLKKDKDCRGADRLSERALDLFEAKGSSTALPGYFKKLSNLHDDAEKCRDAQLENTLRQWGFGPAGASAWMTHLRDVTVPMFAGNFSADFGEKNTLEAYIGGGSGSRIDNQASVSTARTTFTGYNETKVDALMAGAHYWRNIGVGDAFSLGPGFQIISSNYEKRVVEGFGGRTNPPHAIDKGSELDFNVLAGARVRTHSESRWTDGWTFSGYLGGGKQGVVGGLGIGKEFGIPRSRKTIPSSGKKK